MPEWCEVKTEGRIMVRPPPNLTGKSAKDWNKIVDKIYDYELDKAQEELDRFEDKYGPRDETTCLRAQLEAIPPERRE